MENFICKPLNQSINQSWFKMKFKKILISSFYCPVVKRFVLFLWQWFEGVHKCTLNDTLLSVLTTIVKAEVHRLVVVDDVGRVLGVMSLSDILNFLVLNPQGIVLSSMQSSLFREFWFSFSSSALKLITTEYHRAVQWLIYWLICLFVWSIDRLFGGLIDWLIVCWSDIFYRWLYRGWSSRRIEHAGWLADADLDANRNTTGLTGRMLQNSPVTSTAALRCGRL